MDDRRTDEANASSPHWQPSLDQSLQQRTLEVVHIIAERLSNPEQVMSIVREAERQSPHFHWNAVSLASGFPGLALTFGFLTQAFPEESWFEIAARYLALAAEATHTEPFTHLGLFDGLSGMASAVALLYHADQRYRNIYQSLNTQLALQVQEFPWYREDAAGVAVQDYDVLAGAAGILGYLLAVDHPDQCMQEAIQTLLTYLIWLAETDTSSPWLHRWYIPPEYSSQSLSMLYPEGHFHCGLAHGIAGPLAALALAWQRGYRLPGQQSAIDSLARWLIKCAHTDDWGINWPYAIPYPPADRSILQPARAAWCHGAPGISRALWLAGQASGSSVFLQVAVEAMDAVLRRPEKLLEAPASTLCHGKGGLLAIALRFAHETQSAFIRERIPLLVEQILDQFDPSTAYGFQDLDIDTWISDPGLRTGACGVILALLASASNSAPVWDRIFLLA